MRGCLFFALDMNMANQVAASDANEIELERDDPL